VRPGAGGAATGIVCSLPIGRPRAGHRAGPVTGELPSRRCAEAEHGPPESVVELQGPVSLALPPTRTVTAVTVRVGPRQVY
jgi:hypothetical protein